MLDIVMFANLTLNICLLRYAVSFFPFIPKERAFAFISVIFEGDLTFNNLPITYEIEKSTIVINILNTLNSTFLQFY